MGVHRSKGEPFMSIRVDETNAVSPRLGGRALMRVVATSAALGAEIEGVDLGGQLDAPQIADIERALAERGVLVFRDQDLTPEQHIALAERLGGIDVNRFFRPVDGYPQIAEVRKEPDQKANIGGGWHTDHSYDLIPAKASILYVRELPAKGGDTLFASPAAAFEALSPGLRATLRGLRALHSSRHVFGPAGVSRATTDLPGRIQNPELATQDAVHPVVFRHPLTGRESLYVNPGFTVRFEGWSAEKSKPLLDYLYAEITREERIFRLVWRPGTLTIWDNRTTWHCAVNDYGGERRLLHRVTVAGAALN
jgi:taurine dioxygenase